MKKRITQKVVDELKPETKDIYRSDDGMDGFRLKVTPTGKRVLFLGYRDEQGRQRKITFPTTRVDDARRLASAALAKIRDGKDPQAESDRLAAMPTLAAAFATFDADYLGLQCKPATAHEHRRIFHKYIPDRLKRRRLASVTRADMAELMRNMRAAPAMANNVLKMLSAFFNWCEGDGELLPLGSNPTRAVKRNPDVKRSFVFEGSQLYQFSQALDEAEADKTIWPPAVRAARLLLFTGMRKREALTLRWAEVDLPGRRIRLSESKTGRRDVPLGKEAIAILEAALANRNAFPSEYVFPSSKDRSKPIVGFQKTWNKIRRKADLPRLRVHDLRHNYGGVGAAATRSAVHVKGLLGHTQIGTTDRYMKLAEAPLSQAADATNDAIAEQMRPANVLPIGGRR